MSMYTQDEIDSIRREKLIELRESYGKNQKEFCELIGMSPSYYSRLENGGLRITDKTMQKISMSLGITWSNLIEDEKVDAYSQPVEYRKMNIYEINCNYQFERIINRGGSSNKLHMKALLELLMGIENALDYRNQFKDVCENEDKIQDAFLENTFDPFMGLD